MSLSTNNISLAIKYIFLNFAQAYFSKETTRYTWNVDPVRTGIIIADKFSVDLGIANKRPAILLSRGPAGWTNVVRGQYGHLNPHRTGSLKFGSLLPSINDDRIKAQEIVDLYNGTVTYNVVSKQGVETEDIANKLFSALTVHRADFSKVGIFKFNSMNISEERILRHRADFELVGISIDISFLLQYSLAVSDSLYNVRVWVSSDEMFESIDYNIITNGTQIEFFIAPDSGADVVATYVDAVTLGVVEREPIGVGDGITKIFTIPSSGSIYGYYKVFENMVIDVDYSTESTQVLIGER